MNKRVISVDIFRGLTIVLMILVNTPGTWSDVYAPLLHADWHGYTPTDLVFPFFLFIVGTSIVFAYQNKTPNWPVHRKIIIRTLKLLGLGLFLGAFTIDFPFVENFESIRLPGVLQRIGVVFFFASLLFLHCNWRVLIGICLAILLGYWVWMGFIPLNGEAPTFDRAPNNWANYIDLNLLGTHMYKEDYDPEGILSSLPSIATALMGIFTGLILRAKSQSKIKFMIILGIACLFLGYIWDLVFPINKAIWTSSYVLVTAGWANLVLCLIYYFTDYKKIRLGSIFSYAGANAITVYFLSSFFTKLFYLIKVDETQSLHGWLFDTLYTFDFFSLKFSSMLYGLSVAAFYCLLAYVMYKRKIFIKV